MLNIFFNRTKLLNILDNKVSRKFTGLFVGGKNRQLQEESPNYRQMLLMFPPSFVMQFVLANWTGAIFTKLIKQEVV